MSSVASKGFRVDGRVSIAMDALDGSQKRNVQRILADRDHFVACIADEGRVERLSRTRPVFALKVPPGMNIIYRWSGDRIEVPDLMGQAALRRYGAKTDSSSSSHSEIAVSGNLNWGVETIKEHGH
jgi:hypothetical protein